MPSQPQYVWLPGGGKSPNEHAAFRLTFSTTAADTQVSIDHVGVSWYNVFVDGAYAAEGPTRFMGAVPFFATTMVTLPTPGKHVIAVHAHSAGVQTRYLLSTPPAMYCAVASTDQTGHPISAIAWTCAPLSGVYTAGAARLSVLLGWVERCSVSMGLQQTWKAVDFDDSEWVAPAPVATTAAASAGLRLSPPVPLASVGVAPASSASGPLALLEQGTFVERFGYASDDYAARFSLRKLTPRSSGGGKAATAGVAVARDQGRQHHALLRRTRRWLLAAAAVVAAAVVWVYCLSHPQQQPQHHHQVVPAAPLQPDARQVVLPSHDTSYFRFDAGRARLLRPVLVIRAPAGAVVEVCYAQSLIDGRVSPYHPLTGGATCYLDQYALDSSCSAATAVTLCPLEPRGCRFIEVHIAVDDANDPAALASIHLDSATAMFRSYDAYHADPKGSFRCASDTLLENVWAVGVNSTRSCVEDTCIDGPCRERGQWTGDTLAVSLQNLTVMYDDVGPAKLCLLQSSQLCDAHGVISGNCPEVTYPADYALIWFEGAVAYWKATGDTALLAELLPRATKCMDYFLSSACYKTGVGFAPPYSAVIDWGYSDNHAFPVDMALNAMLLSSLDALVEWVTASADPAAVAKYTAARQAQVQLLRAYLDLPAHATAGGVTKSEADCAGSPCVAVVVEPPSPRGGTAFDPAKLGMHAAGLLLRTGLFDAAADAAARQAAVAYLQSQLSGMFPLAPLAPRLSEPARRSAAGFYTPYFQTFTFPGLYRAGAADFVLDQYRKAWGWALQQCDSTWLEVFDNRWEVVHSWGGCPTWQLSQFVLGFTRRADAGPRHYEFALHVGTKLPGASGSIPTGDGGAALAVAWERGQPAAGSITVTLTVADSPVSVCGWPSTSATAAAAASAALRGGPVFVPLAVGTHSAVFKEAACV